MRPKKKQSVSLCLSTQTIFPKEMNLKNCLDSAFKRSKEMLQGANNNRDRV